VIKINKKQMANLLKSFVNFLRHSKKTLSLILIVAVLTITLNAAISIWLSRIYDIHVPSIATIRTIDVEVYGGDINLTQDGKQYIDWGTIYLGELLNRSFYVRSKSNTETTLNLTIANLTFQNSQGENVIEPPPIESPLNLTWNYYNTTISPSQEIYVTLTLRASSDSSFIDYLITNDVKNFSFNVVIQALEEH
jgi:hypothetical protein